MNLLLSALRIALGVYVGLSLLLFLRQASYVYYPERSVGLTPAYLGLAFEDVRLTTADGETLAAWFVPAAAAAPAVAPEAVETLRVPRRALLFCHGNGGNIGHRVDALLALHKAGLDVLIFDYRGYGESTGKLSERGTYLDAEAAWKHLRENRGYSEDRIVLFGESLGGAVATWLAGRVKPGALVVESSFTSVPDMAVRMYPYLPVRLLCRFRYDSRRGMASVRCPVVVAHSRDDEMVPFEHGRRLFDAAPEPKRFIEMRGGHNDGGLTSSSKWMAALRVFLDEHTGGAGGNAGQSQKR